MSDFRLMIDGVIVPAAVEGQGQAAIAAHVAAANPAVADRLADDLAAYETANPARAAAERAAFAAAQASVPIADPAILAEEAD